MKRKQLTQEEIQNKSKKGLYERAKDLLCLLNYKPQPFSHYPCSRKRLESTSLILFYTNELDNILSFLGLNSEDLEKSESQIDKFNAQFSNDNKDLVDITGARRELLERHREYGENNTDHIVLDLLRDELQRDSESFYSNLLHKIDHYTNKEENSNTDKEAQKYADICSVYVSMQHILDDEKEMA